MSLLLRRRMENSVTMLLNIYVKLFFPCGAAAERRSRSPHSRGFQITHNDAPQPVGLLWTSDQPVAETSTRQHTTLTPDNTPMPPAGFKSKTSADERPQNYTLDLAATGTGSFVPLQHTNFFYFSGGCLERVRAKG
jgi:hypothetical protein